MLIREVFDCLKMMLSNLFCWTGRVFLFLNLRVLCIDVAYVIRGLEKHLR